MSYVETQREFLFDWGERYCLYWGGQYFKGTVIFSSNEGGGTTCIFWGGKQVTICIFIEYYLLFFVEQWKIYIYIYYIYAGNHFRDSWGWGPGDWDLFNVPISSFREAWGMVTSGFMVHWAQQPGNGYWFIQANLLFGSVMFLELQAFWLFFIGEQTLRRGEVPWFFLILNLGVFFSFSGRIVGVSFFSVQSLRLIIQNFGPFGAFFLLLPRQSGSKNLRFLDPSRRIFSQKEAGVQW